MSWLQCPVCRQFNCQCGTAPQPWPPYYPPVYSYPMGCVCPPTSEKTCGNPMCPRKAPKVSATGATSG